jgi:hypothetical protein
MSKKFAILKSNIVDAIAIADTPLDTGHVWVDLTDISPEPGPGWFYNNGVFTQPPAPLLSAKIITKLAFRFRFTDAEYAGIITAAKTDAEVQVWYDTFNMVTAINLDNQRTKDGVANLVSKNLLTQSRADEILTTALKPEEQV